MRVRSDRLLKCYCKLHGIDRSAFETMPAAELEIEYRKFVAWEKTRPDLSGYFIIV